MGAKAALRGVGHSLIVIAVLIALIFTVASLDWLVESHRDANTRIEQAKVISKDKTTGTRRSLPSYYLVIQEEGKEESTRVSVTMGAWIWCEQGAIYNDLPGERGSCERKPTMIEVPSFEIPEMDL